jgi:hypothetical protein
LACLIFVQGAFCFLLRSCKRALCSAASSLVKSLLRVSSLA